MLAFHPAGAGVGVLLVSVADMADVQSHAWLSVSQVIDSDHSVCSSQRVCGV